MTKFSRVNALLSVVCCFLSLCLSLSPKSQTRPPQNFVITCSNTPEMYGILGVDYAAKDCEETHHKKPETPLRSPNTHSVNPPGRV